MNSLQSNTQPEAVVVVAHSAIHKVLSTKIYLTRQQPIEVSTTNKTVNKVLKSLAGKYSPYKIMCMNKRSKEKAVAVIDKYLPDKYKGNPVIHKLICKIVSGEKYTYKDNNDWVSISAKELDSSFKSLYRPSLNTIDRDCETSVMEMLRNEMVIFRDEYYSDKTSKTYWYRLNKSILPQQVNHAISLAILKNMKVIFEQGFTNGQYDESLVQLLERRSLQPVADTYTIKEPDNVRLSGLADDILRSGLIGANYLSRELLLATIQNITQDIYQQKGRLIIEKCQQEAVVKGGPPIAPPIADIIPCRVHSTVSVHTSFDCFMQIDKLLTIFGSTVSVSDELSILFHRSPQLISYTGRLFETGNLGTTGLKKSVKASNYSLIEQVTGFPVMNYDLRSSQISGIITLGKLGGFKFPYLENYAVDKSERKRLAFEIGIPASVFKVLVLVKVFGGKNEFNAHYPTSFQEVLAVNNIPVSDMDSLIKKFNSVAKYLIADINEWANSTVPTIINYFEHSATEYSNGVTIVKKSFLQGSLKKQSAFLLQGLEARFINELIRLSVDPAYKYHFLSYEYDGLITLGEIPPEAIQRASICAEYPNAILETKPIN